MPPAGATRAALRLVGPGNARRSVRTRLIVTILVTTVSVLFIAGTATLVHDASVYRKSWAADVASEADVIAMATAPALAFDDPQLAGSRLAALETRTGIRSAALYSADGTRYATFARDGAALPPADIDGHAPGTNLNGQTVEIVREVTSNGQKLGTLYLQARYDLAGRARTYAGIFAFVGLLGIAAAIVLSSILQRLITLPLEQIGAVARRIVDEQDYSLRVTGNRSEDEIGLLVRALNRMLEEIEAHATALKHSNLALQEADRKKDEFVATLAHELRNPLAPIRNASMILESPALTEAQRRWGREVIARQVRHMSLLLDDLLDVSRITRGRLELKISRVSLDSVVSAAIETARPLIDAKHHHLDVQLLREELELNVDPLRIAQAISNLLTNAAKYTDDGSRITIRAERDGGQLVISVEDMGIGLSPETLGTIFDMFAQVEGSLERSQGGLGIGLSLVKGLITLHGGTVEASSPGLGKGSRFVLRLPAACVIHDIASAPAAASALQADAGMACRLVIADDNRDAADSLALVLRSWGHVVLVAYSAREAKALATDHLPDACIFDIGMPETNGYELARWVREQPWGRSILLMALTGWGQREDVEAAARAGFDRHFTKPVDATAIQHYLVANWRQAPNSAGSHTGRLGLT